MKQIFYQVDAFTDKIFGGNPAGVCPLDEWLSDKLMQKIAAENNLSETAFFVKEGEKYHIRWFTPHIEMDLCGHATLASAYVINKYTNDKSDKIIFTSLSGELVVEVKGNIYELDFPAREGEETDFPRDTEKTFGKEPVKCIKARDYLLIFDEDEDFIKNMRPDFGTLKTYDVTGIIVSNKGQSCDFVSRFFAPGAGIEEDPVTGSSHCTLIPYWAETLGKNELLAKQLSERGGVLYCKMEGDRVKIGGKAVTYLTGEIEI